MTVQPKIVPAGEGARWAVFDETIRGLVLAGDSGGRIAVGEVTVPPGGGPPPHVHEREDEVFYVLDGELEAFSNGTWTRVTTGGTIFLPRGLPHTFRNAADRPCRFLVVITPGGFEGYFAELSSLAAGGQFTPADAVTRGIDYGLTYLAG